MKEVTAAIIRDGDKILICQRAADDECAMLWEFPGGKGEKGEALDCTYEDKVEIGIKTIKNKYRKRIWNYCCGSNYKSML